MRLIWEVVGVIIIISSFLIKYFIDASPDILLILQLIFVVIGIMCIGVGLLSGISKQLENIEITYEPIPEKKLKKKSQRKG